jgi:hypothetical protein
VFLISVHCPSSLQAQGGYRAYRTMPRGRGRQSDELLHQTVRVTNGVYKGLVGIVVDTTDKTARVELHTTCKTITVNKSQLTTSVTPASSCWRAAGGSRGMDGMYAPGTPMRPNTPMRPMTPSHAPGTPGHDWDPSARPSTPGRDWDVTARPDTPGHDWDPSAQPSSLASAAAGQMVGTPSAPGTPGAPSTPYMGTPAQSTFGYEMQTPMQASAAGAPSALPYTPHAPSTPGAYMPSTPGAYGPTTPAGGYTPTTPGVYAPNTPNEGYTPSYAPTTPHAPTTPLEQSYAPATPHDQPTTPSTSAYDWRQSGMGDSGYGLAPTPAPPSYDTPRSTDVPPTPSSVATPMPAGGPGTPYQGGAVPPPPSDDGTAAAAGAVQLPANWVSPQLEVEITQGPYTGQRAVVLSPAGTLPIQLLLDGGAGEVSVDGAHALAPCKPTQKKQQVLILQGEWAGMRGVLVGIDNQVDNVGIVKLQETRDIMMLKLGVLGVLRA